MTGTVRGLGGLTVLLVFIGMVVKYVLTWCRQEEIRVYFCGIQPIVQFVYNLKDFSHYLTSKLCPDTASARTLCSESCTMKRRALRSS